MKSKLSHKFVSGFTLIELMVTVGIFAFMTALILARYSSFNSGTLLTNTAYDIALTIRQAQTYGMSVMTNNASSPNFSSAYGVYFNKSTTSLFKFVANSGMYGGNTYSPLSDSTINTYNLKQGATIKSLCAGNICSGSSQNFQMSIMFLRPDPSAIISYSTSNGNGAWSTGISSAQIVVTSGDGSNSHTIVIRQNGQISVQ